MDPVSIVLGVVFVVALVFIIRSNNKGKAKAKELDTIGAKVAKDIKEENETR